MLKNSPGLMDSQSLPSAIMASMQEGPTLYHVLSLCTIFCGRASSHEFSICPDSLCSSCIHTPSIVLTFQRG